MSDMSTSSRQVNQGVGILKSLWRRNQAGKWTVHDLQGLDLEPREGFEHHYFKIKPEIAGNKTIFVESGYFAKMIPPSSFTNEAREAMANAYNSFKKGK